MKEKCLVCGGELEIDQSLDIEFKGDTVYSYVLGNCVECGCPHKWTEVYKLTETKDLQIDEDLVED